MTSLKILMYLLISLVISFYIWNPIIEDAHQYIPEDIPAHIVPEHIDSIDLTFGVCVYIILEIGELCGLSYNATNIWIFVIIMPSLLVILFIYCISLRKKIRKLRLLSPH